MKVIDSIPEFLKWYEKAKDLPDDQIISSFKSNVIHLDESFYEFEIDSLRRRGYKFETEVVKLVKEFEDEKTKFKFYHDNLKANLDKGMKNFINLFPEFVFDVPMHICHSFLEYI